MQETQCFFSQEPKTKKLLHETKSDGNGRRRRDDNAFCASLSLDDSHSRGVSLPLLPKFTFLLRFSFWLIISRSRCVFKENPIIIQWSCIPRNYFPCSIARCRVAVRRGETANEIVGEMRCNETCFVGVLEWRQLVACMLISGMVSGFQLWSFCLCKFLAASRTGTGDCFLNGIKKKLKQTDVTEDANYSSTCSSHYGTHCAWSAHFYYFSSWFP